MILVWIVNVVEFGLHTLKSAKITLGSTFEKHFCFFDADNFSID
jgi:hypothetical protein